MKIEITKPKETQQENPQQNKPSVVIASKLKRVRETFDKYGNLIKRTED
jgi:hypothetical protein